MNEFLSFIDQNSGALMVIFTAVVTVSTLVYAILTALLTIETRKMREVQTEPRIEVVLKPTNEEINIVILCIKNIGLGPAYDIRFEIEKEEGGKGADQLIKDITKANFFKTGLRYLGPNQEISAGYSQFFEDFEEKIKSVLSLTVNYRNINSRKRCEKFRVDCSELLGLTQVGKPHLYAIAKNLEKLQKDFHHISTGFNRIKADIYSFEDRERERFDREKRFVEFNQENK